MITQKSYSFNLDMKQKKIYDIKFTQGDSKSNVLDIVLTQDGQAYDLLTNTVYLYAKKSDGTTVFISSLDKITIVDATNGNVKCELTDDMVSAKGLVEAEIIVFGADNERVSSARFNFTVNESLVDGEAIESLNDFIALTSALSSLAEYETYKANVDTNTTNIANNTAELISVSSSLEEKATKVELNALGQLKLEGNYDTLALLQAAHPTGAEGLYLVVEDGYTYRWSGTVWTQAVQFQSTGIGNGTIFKSALKTDAINYLTDTSRVDLLNMDKYMCHRGTIEQIYPENTKTGHIGVESYNYALELDVLKTKDNILVLSHDDTVDRCSNGVGFIADMYYDDLMQLNFNYGYQKFIDEKIPTLENVFKKYGKSKIYLLDIKSLAGGISTILVAQMIVKYNLQNNVIVGAYTIPDITNVHSVDSSIECGTVYNTSKSMDYYVSSGYKWVFFGSELLQMKEKISEAHAVGLKVNVSVVKNKLVNNKYIALGVDSIMCKNPSYLDGTIATTQMGLPFTIPFSNIYLNQEWAVDTIHEKVKYQMVGDGIEESEISSNTLDYCTYVAKKLTNNSFKLNAIITPKVLNATTTKNVGFHFSNCDEFPIGPNGVGAYRASHGFVAEDMANSYQIYFRQDGFIGITEVLNGTAAGVSGAAWGNSFTPMAVSVPLNIEIIFTATTISVQVNGGVVRTVTNSDVIRDFYIGFTWGQTAAKISNVVLSAV
ncbi:BppU family phage baseplate upper protein [Clostridium grantii]|uniref:Glycerophosphoryl diester phosphodiesterase n=1 Tax=Clostridium grantii DSM 8605 TaxID=1121316 RepID=A0A1M5SCI2_9CLOT|nr:BppU family phage baseplate upper protein [Clostridium grantii]SHH35998.1 Glycerophosphoryl diester phosphodiesterase [Clostridium grantii DSM 8605]